MRERRVSVQRTAGRRRLRRLLAVVVVLAIIGGAIAVVLSPLLALDDVTVVGAGARDAEVRAVVDDDRGSALLLLDTGDVADRVKRLSWVADAEVERELPSSLRIAVTPRVPVAWARAADGTVALVDDRGVVLAGAPSPPEGLVELRGVTRVPAPGSRISPLGGARVAAALGPLAGRVDVVAAAADGQAVLHMFDGPEIRFGALDRLDEKARSAAAVIGAADPGTLTYVDVRVPSAPVTG
jgi:cell division protein FtsQ